MIQREREIIIIIKLIIIKRHNKINKSVMFFRNYISIIKYYYFYILYQPFENRDNFDKFKNKIMF